MCVHREATQGGAFQAGFCCIIFSEIFSLALNVSPSMISGEATVETKKELLEKSNNPWFLFSHDEKGSP